MDCQSDTNYGRKKPRLNPRKDAFSNSCVLHLEGKKFKASPPTSDSDGSIKKIHRQGSSKPHLLFAIHSWPQIGKVTKKMVSSYSLVFGLFLVWT
ncbi:BnaC07g06430D [Brassica napus]|uniref:BnaC07g06430D protein n=1 Tax=Brassica napus TaxID=3708 RepID=A0A078IJ29_BRANA|nr:BnaC07g06430D [Brassica napus]